MKLKDETIKKYFSLVIFSAPLYLVRIFLFGLPTNALELLTILAILVSVISQRKKIFYRLSTLPKNLLLSCVLILVGISLSIVSNKNTLTGLGILKGWFLVPILFSLSIYSLVDSVSDIELFFKAIFFSAGAMGAVSLIYKFLGITTYDGRLSSFYLSPNYLAMYLAPGIFFGLYFLVKSSEIKKPFSITSFLHKKYSWRFVLYIFLLLIILAPIYYTYSYGTWFAVFMSLLIMLILTVPAKKYLLAGALILLFCGAFLIALQFSTQKFSSLISFSPRSSYSSRITIWQVSLRLIKENSILGIGPGNFQGAYLDLQKYYSPYLEWAVPQPHNIFLAFWLQAGILGLAGFLLLLFLILGNLLMMVRETKNAAMAAPLLGFFFYTILHGLIDTTYWKNDLSFLFWICTLLIFSLRDISQKNKLS